MSKRPADPKGKPRIRSPGGLNADNRRAAQHLDAACRSPSSTVRSPPDRKGRPKPSGRTYPSVYIEEILSGGQTITGVSTSVTAFVGRRVRDLQDGQTGARSSVRVLAGQRHDVSARLKLGTGHGGTETGAVAALGAAAESRHTAQRRHLASSERRGRDSNPRSALTDSGFQDQRIQPLCHPSGRQSLDASSEEIHRTSCPIGGAIGDHERRRWAVPRRPASRVDVAQGGVGFPQQA
jgi:hypothetical protein